MSSPRKRKEIRKGKTWEAEEVKAGEEGYKAHMIYLQEERDCETVAKGLGIKQESIRSLSSL